MAFFETPQFRMMAGTLLFSTLGTLGLTTAEAAGLPLDAWPGVNIGADPAHDYTQAIPAQTDWESVSPSAIQQPESTHTTTFTLHYGGKQAFAPDYQALPLSGVTQLEQYVAQTEAEAGSTATVSFSDVGSASNEAYSLNPVTADLGQEDSLNDNLAVQRAEEAKQVIESVAPDADVAVSGHENVLTPDQVATVTDLAKKYGYSTNGNFVKDYNAAEIKGLSAADAKTMQALFDDQREVTITATITAAATAEQPVAVGPCDVVLQQKSTTAREIIQHDPGHGPLHIPLVVVPYVPLNRRRKPNNRTDDLATGADDTKATAEAPKPARGTQTHTDVQESTLGLDHELYKRDPVAWLDKYNAERRARRATMLRQIGRYGIIAAAGITLIAGYPYAGDRSASKTKIEPCDTITTTTHQGHIGWHSVWAGDLQLIGGTSEEQTVTTKPHTVIRIDQYGNVIDTTAEPSSSTTTWLMP